MTRSVALAACLTLALSGCVSGGVGAISDADKPAPAATFDESTGALEGYVVNDALEPIAGAAVGIKETGHSATTNEDGAFAFGDLAPGLYTLFAQALGYESQARTATAEPGRSIEVQFVLTQLPLDEPFTQVLRFEGLIECAWGVQGVATGNCVPIQSTLQQYNLPNPTNTKIIGLFSFPDHLKIEGGVFELAWNPSAALTSGNLQLSVEKELTGISGGGYAARSGKSPVRVTTDDQPWKDLVLTDKNKDQVQTRTFPAPTNPPTFVANQRFSVFATACYIEECPETYSALKDA